MIRLLSRILTAPFRLLRAVGEMAFGVAGATATRRATGALYKRVTGDEPPKPSGMTTGKAVAYAAGAGALAGISRYAMRSVLARDDSKEEAEAWSA